MKLYTKIKVTSFCLILLSLQLVYTQENSSEEKTSVPIIRQINKVNDDGTYTYGYEAADGSFKIETRDVLGNIKGMFGFIDESGILKRVSYTANNETGFRNSILHAPISTSVRTPSSESSRRPVLILKNTPALHSPTKGPVIQHIPKKIQKDEDEPSTTTDYINARRFPLNRNNTSEEHNEEYNKSQNINPLRKILVSKRPIEDKEIRGKGGNDLRRQLSRGLDLRGEMTHIYAGGDNRFSPNLPPHLSALMSELKPIQVVQAAAPETLGYQTIDVEASSQEINEKQVTTTELPYGTRKFVPPPNSIAYIRPRYRSTVPSPEESQYLQEVSPQYRGQNTPISLPPPPPPPPPPPSQLPLPISIPNGNYQTQPNYYDQPPLSVIPPTLRDELLAIIYNYLQVRLGPMPQNSYYPRYPPYSPLVNPLYTPNYAYTPFNYGPAPYVNPYFNIPQSYYSSLPNPNSLFGIPTQAPYNNPNVQFLSRPDHLRRSPHRLQITRSAADDADLLQMLLSSPTRMPISQLKYSPTTERLSHMKNAQPIRNLQIISDTTEAGGLTTDSSE
ncbi:hypothetical protein PGB90_001941 [Kerria lacca]